MDTGLSWTDRGGLVGLLIALAVLAGGTLKADPARAAGFPLVVNDTADRPDVSVGNGVCATSAGRCTLRAAIQEANMRQGADTITVPGGTYPIRIGENGGGSP